ncbi:MAG: ribonuclease [Clostridium sp.]|nr:ribonuclease [Clostridium sp.]
MTSPSQEDKSISQSETAEETTEAFTEESEEETAAETEEEPEESPEASVTEDGEYTSKEEVAEYIHLFGHLPSNFITKKEAKALGWEGGDSLGKLAPGKSIGGDRFGNYEGQLPDEKGRKYTECDIDYKGKKRNAKRIVFSNDGLIFYTDDHYKTFEQLY